MVDWQRGLANKLAPATVNNHLASLAGFTTWVSAQEPGLFTTGNPLHRCPRVAAATVGTTKPHPGAGEITQELVRSARTLQPT